MADVTSNSSGKNRSLSKKPRSKKQSLRVDMTPMVDLAFLLISFFMLTIVISDPRAMPLDKRVGDDRAPIGDCQVLNILVDSADHVYTYQGMDFKTLKASSFDSENGVRQVILNKGRQVKAECGLQPDGQKRQMVCLIKLLPGSHYESMVRILDEMEITATKVYSLQEPLADEVKEVKKMELLAEK
jgi:biopolymer transport protein ExbD